MDIKILSRADLIELLDMPSVIEGVEAVYKEKARGNAIAWPLVEHHFEGNGVMDIRSGCVLGDIRTHGAKLLNNFPLNAEKNLPVFSGVLMVFDSNTGLPLGILDASYITSLRTGAAAAIGCSTLARKDSQTLLLLGAGRQSIYLLGATLIKMPNIRNVIVVDPLSFDFAKDYAGSIESRLKEELDIDVSNVKFEASSNLEEACRKSDVIITITRSTAPLIMKDWLKEGAHLSCVGADMVGKEEIDPEIFKTARSFADDVKQCLKVGEMEIPHKLGYISEEEVCAEIGEVLLGVKSGRLSESDITVFDATGLAALDLATAKIAMKKAMETGVGQTVSL